MKHIEDRYQNMIADAAAQLIAVADDTAISLVDVIATMERHVVTKTKVGDAAKCKIPPGRRGYTLRRGRLIEMKTRSACVVHRKDDHG